MEAALEPVSLTSKPAFQMGIQQATTATTNIHNKSCICHIKQTKIALMSLTLSCTNAIGPSFEPVKVTSMPVVAK